MSPPSPPSPGSVRPPAAFPDDVGAGEAVLLLDRDGRVADLDDRAEELLGWGRDEARGHRAIDLLARAADHPRLEAVFGSLFRSAPSPDARRRMAMRLLRRDGGTLDVDVRLAVAGALVRVLLAPVERPADDASRAAWLDDVAAACSDAVVSVDAAGTVRTMNPAAERLYGFSAAWAVGRQLGEGLSAEHAARSREGLERVLAGGTLAGSRRRYDRPDGASVWTETVATTTRAPDGALTSVTFVSRDVTGDERARTDLEQRLEHLRSLPRPQTSREPRGAAAGEELVRLLDRALPHLQLDTIWLTRMQDGIPVLETVAGDPEVLGPAAVAGFVADPRTSLCRAMLDGEVPATVPDLRDDARLVDYLRPLGAIRAYAGAPVVLGDGTVYGAVGAASSRPLPDIGESDRRAVGLVAAVLADAVDRHRTLGGDLAGAARRATVDSLVAALDARDRYTAEHSDSVVRLCSAVAAGLGLDAVATAEVELVARLHDIGKVGVPDAVLHKPGPLDEREWALMREHPAIGERIVGSVDSLAHVAAAVRAEHERWDGTGYPDGLAGDAIPVPSRIVLVCDAWHAMMSDRPYRPRLTHARAEAELRRCSGSQFDPTAVEALLRILGEAAPQTPGPG